MRVLILRIRNGGLFIGPKHWLVDHGTHYDFHLGFVRRRIFKNSIDSFYEISSGYIILILPFLIATFLIWSLILVSLKGIFNLVRMLLRF